MNIVAAGSAALGAKLTGLPAAHNLEAAVTAAAHLANQLYTFLNLAGQPVELSRLLANQIGIVRAFQDGSRLAAELVGLPLKFVDLVHDGFCLSESSVRSLSLRSAVAWGMTSRERTP